MTDLKPLITICGTTGVGKSKLSIELALKLAQESHPHGWKGARIINADSMQVYTGMDVITNKVPIAERMGVEHLLMDFKKPGEQYVVGEWVRDAIQAIDETHKMGKVPIVVGGTSYWIQHLVFPNRLPTPSQSSSEVATKAIANLSPDLLQLFNALPEQPPSATTHPEDAVRLHKLLTALDEPVAQRWHWKDTRKVIGSIRVIKDTGRTPSEIISEQSKIALSPRYRTLCLWPYAELDVLNDRLDARVDDMIKQGLLDEIKQLQAIAFSSTSSSSKFDYTLGLYQCIGYKEFHDYLVSRKPTERLFASAVEQMKNGTKQYAKRQIRWLRNKLLPAIYKANSDRDHSTALVPTYVLDATELGDHWTARVLNQAESIMEAFLANDTLPDPLSLSERAREMLTIDVRPTDPEEVLRAQKKKICSVCTVDSSQPFMVDGPQWEVHGRSRLHRARATRLAKLRGKKKGGRPFKRQPKVDKDTSKEAGTSKATDQQCPI